MQRSGARARIKGEVFLPVFTEHAEEKLQKDAQAPLMVKRRSGIECQCLG
ncbi:hypothetical protein COPCOM_03033 [Coprococcus comes ATCC 27758]|uniref:Uncharacterized protein n=1 Tax=Coprococcus comes ATCC 27758 TaxID=470146 RepID=C0BCZ2_9FIRM|nr:hypothetical protein COPCOM_03033 [Coprococcus comes ATCC 27758]